MPRKKPGPYDTLWRLALALPGVEEGTSYGTPAFKVAGKLGQAPGFAGPAGKKAAEVLTKYIIVDMYAKAIQGASAEDSVKWAEGELKRIYA